MNAQYICPIVTAFHQDGTVDMETMKMMYDRLIAGGINGIAVMGSSGEFYSMSLETAKCFAKESVQYLKGKIPVYVGTGRLTPEETIDLSNCAIQCGADAVMIVGPYYIGAESAGVEAYYDQVIGQVDGNVILYNYPDRTGHDISAEVVLRLLEKHKNIIGYKDTVGAPSHTRELILKIKPQYPQFRIYSGYDDNFAHVVNSGGDGCIAALSNLVPNLCARWVGAFEQGCAKEISQVQQVIDRLMEFYSICTPFMPAMKYALEKEGIPITTACKLPAVEPDSCQKEQIDELLNFLKKNSLI